MRAPAISSIANPNKSALTGSTERTTLKTRSPEKKDERSSFVSTSSSKPRKPIFGSDFFKFLRHLAQSGDIAFIVATKSPLNELYRRDESSTSGFSNVFTTLKLGELAEGEASDLVGKPRNGHAFSSNEVEQILALAGRHPYWLNYLCAQAYKAKQAGRLDRKAFDAIEARLN